MLKYSPVETKLYRNDFRCVRLGTFSAEQEAFTEELMRINLIEVSWNVRHFWGGVWPKMPIRTYDDLSNLADQANETQNRTDPAWQGHHSRRLKTALEKLPAFKKNIDEGKGNHVNAFRSLVSPLLHAVYGQSIAVRLENLNSRVLALYEETTARWHALHKKYDGFI
jgi:hypothetical protein